VSTPQSDSAQPAAGSSGPQAPAYRLALEPDDRSWTARENLVDILKRELLGPANGPDEILDGVPDSAYLIGRIAPVRLTAGQADPGEAGSDDAATDVGDAVDAAESRGVPLTAVDDSSASSDEDEVEDQPQKRGLMIPASMGLRFQIPDDLDEFTVTASWGTYEPVKEKRGEGTEDGEGEGAAPARYCEGDQGCRPEAVPYDRDRAQGQDPSSGGSLRRLRAWLPADRGGAVQRPGDASQDPGRGVAVPDQAVSVGRWR
jgi:hypothetical protein